MSNTTRGVAREIKDGFVSAPKGCYIQLERMAARYILDNIQASYGNTAGLVSRAASFTEDSGLALTLANFLDYCYLDPRARVLRRQILLPVNVTSTTGSGEARFCCLSGSSKWIEFPAAQRLIPSWARQIM